MSVRPDDMLDWVTGRRKRQRTYEAHPTSQAVQMQEGTIQLEEGNAPRGRFSRESETQSTEQSEFEG